MFKTIIIFIVLLFFIGCSTYQAEYHDYNQDIVKEMFTNEDKKIYTFVGDNYTYIFKDNLDDENLSKKMAFMFQLIENAKSWEFATEPFIGEYTNNNDNKTKYKSIVSISIIPSNEQLVFFNHVAPDYKQNFQNGIQNAGNYVEVVKNFAGYKNVYMYFRGYWWKHYYTFDFFYDDVIKIQTTPEIKKRFSKYLLSQPIQVKLEGPLKFKTKHSIDIEKPVTIVVGTTGILALAAITLPIAGLKYSIDSLLTK